MEPLVQAPTITVVLAALPLGTPLRRVIMAAGVMQVVDLSATAAHTVLHFHLIAVVQVAMAQSELCGPAARGHSLQLTQNHSNHDVHYSYRRWQTF